MYPSSLGLSPPHFTEFRYRTIVEEPGVYRLWLFPCRLSFREYDLPETGSPTSTLLGGSVNRGKNTGRSPYTEPGPRVLSSV